MVSTKEKREFNERMIKMALSSGQVSQIQRQQHEFLLRDTNGGKLYKYRAFDPNGYALENLQNGTLHCSKPDDFNDPFDCKIGMTFKSLFEEKFGDKHDALVEILEKFMLIMHGEMELQVCNVVEQRIIRELLSDQKVMQFITDNQNLVQTEEQMVEKLKGSMLPIIEIMQTILKDEEFEENLGSCTKKIPHIMKNINLGAMIQSSNDNVNFEDYARANGVMDDTDEVGLVVSLGKEIYPENTKDFEMVQKFFYDMEQKMKFSCLVGCLCTDFKNRLMWSHYAEGHKGFCVEYDFSGTDEDTLSKLPLPIFYTERRPPIPWKIAWDNTPETIEEVNAQFMMGLLTKDSAWEYENEWRILIPNTEYSEVKMPRVSCIYLGAVICENNRDEILKIAKKLCIPVKQMKVDRGAYDLHAEDVIL